MPGLTDLTATSLLNDATGAAPFPAIGSRWVGLFSTAPTSDSGVTGATELSGSGYARVQVAGAITVNGATLTSSPTLHVASVPAWLAALGTGAGGNGVNVYDATTLAQVGTIASCVAAGTTITLTGNASSAVGATDSLLFSAFPLGSNSSGSEPVTTPASVTNGAQVNFAQSTGVWSNSVAFGNFDAATTGNCKWWDYLGNFKWIPFTCTLASPGVLSTDATADAPANGLTVVVTAKFGGTLPTTGGSFAGLLTTAGLSGATFNVGVNTTSIGAGQFRQVVAMVVGSSTTVFFPTSSLTLTAA